MFDETLEKEWLALIDLLMSESNVTSDSNSLDYESLPKDN